MSNLLELDGRLQPIAKQWLELCNEHFKTVITVTYRGAEAQNAAKAAGLSNASSGLSPHNCESPGGIPASRAFDYAIYADDGSYIKDGIHPRYTQAGQIGKDLGLSWGGDWHHPDYDHLEMINWKNLG